MNERENPTPQHIIFDTGKSCMEEVRYFGHSVYEVEQKYMDVVSASPFRRRAHAIDSLTPESVSDVRVVLGSGQHDPLTHAKGEFVEYSTGRADSVFIDVHDPFSPSNEDMFMTFAIHDDAPLQGGFLPTIKELSPVPPDFQTVQQASDTLKEILTNLIDDPQTMTAIESMESTESWNDANMQIARLAANRSIVSLLHAVFPDNEQQRQKALVILKGIGAIDHRANVLRQELQVREYSQQMGIPEEPIDQDEEFISSARSIMVDLSELMREFPVPIFVCDLNEFGVAYSTFSSKDTDDEESSIWDTYELKPKKVAPYKTTIWVPEGNYGYWFDKNDEWITVICYVGTEEEHEEKNKVLVKNTSASVLRDVMRDLRRDFGEIARTHGVIKFHSAQGDMATDVLVG